MSVERTDFGMRTFVATSLNLATKRVQEILKNQGLVLLDKSVIPQSSSARSAWLGGRLALLTFCDPALTTYAASAGEDASLLLCRIGVHEAADGGCTVSVADLRKTVSSLTSDRQLIRLVARTQDRLLVALLLLARDGISEARWKPRVCDEPPTTAGCT